VQQALLHVLHDLWTVSSLYNFIDSQYIDTDDTFSASAWLVQPVRRCMVYMDLASIVMINVTL